MKNNLKRIHFIGIGGAGMSGLAKVLTEQGLKISGSDIKESNNTKNLRDLGVDIKIGHKASNIDKAQAVVISSAIKPDNVELIEANKRNIKIYQRAQMLAFIAKDNKVIAISGTHGKTTTTSMISLIFENNKLDPTFLIGGELNDIGSNAKYGQSDYFIAETDESDGSLLHFDPDLLIVTNIEADHLDYFETFERISDLFKTFLAKIRPGGKAIVYADHPNIAQLIPYVNEDVITFGLNPGNDYHITDFKQAGLGSSFKVYKHGKKLGSIALQVPGLHNALNALAAIATGVQVGLTFQQIGSALKAFSGVKRRFQLLGQKDSVSIYDDYAHHPTEVASTLKAAADAKNGRLVCIFQPHRYSRTSFLAKDFGMSFANADLVIVTDVYSAGENPIPGVSGKLITDAILENEGNKNIAYLPHLHDVVGYLEQEIKPGDMIITMGAGDIWTVGQKLLA